jgi:hypothetical protein
MKDNQFAIVELKYGTRTIQGRKNPPRFEESLDTQISIVKTQGAQDIMMYNYCKDMRRIEYLSEKFPNLVGGVALLITNDYLYWTRPTKSVAYERFSLHDGNVIQGVVWTEPFSQKVITSHPNFSLSNSYCCQWNDTAWNQTEGENTKQKKGRLFRYLLTVVDNSKISKR